MYWNLPAQSNVLKPTSTIQCIGMYNVLECTMYWNVQCIGMYNVLEYTMYWNVQSNVLECTGICCNANTHVGPPAHHQRSETPWPIISALSQTQSNCRNATQITQYNHHSAHQKHHGHHGIQCNVSECNERHKMPY